MREWIDEYLEEIQKIEIFYNTKFLEFSHEFDMLKDALHRKKYGNKKVKHVKYVQNSAFQGSSNQQFGSYLQSN